MMVGGNKKNKKNSIRIYGDGDERKNSETPTETVSRKIRISVHFSAEF